MLDTNRVACGKRSNFFGLGGWHMDISSFGPWKRTAIRTKLNPWLRSDISDGTLESSILNKNGSWAHFNFSSILCLDSKDVHGKHDPGRWIHHSPWTTTHTKRAWSSHTTRRKGSNKKRSAYGSRTVPRSMLGFVRDRLDWWFDGTTSAKNSKFLRRELAFSPMIIFLFFSILSWILCRSGSELCLGCLCCNARSVNHYIGSWWQLPYIAFFRE